MTLATEQIKATTAPKARIVLTGASTYTYYENDRILDVSFPEGSDSQTATVLLNNDDQVLSAINLSGYAAVISFGLTIAGTDTYEARPPLKVIAQDFYSAPGVLVCQLTCIGIPNLLEADKASADYNHYADSVKTVEDLLTEVLDGTAVPETIKESQTTEDSGYSISSVDPMVGQRLFIRNRTVTKLAFKLSKSGSPTGLATFTIKSWDEATTYATKTFDVSTLDATPTELEVTFATPVLIDNEVFIYPAYADGDFDNYVVLQHNNSSVKDNENLVRMPVSDWVDYPAKDLYYTYSYTGAGVTVFSHCTAYTATYDSKDGLIDTYLPKDSLIIRQGQSRLSVVNTLLAYTTNRKRVEDDGEVHFLVPTIAGTAYSFNFSLESGHTFFNKSLRQALIIPNKVTVESYPEDADQYSGSRTSAASYALLPIEDFQRAKLASTAQAASIAGAVISNLELEQQKGSATVPMDVLSQVYDYGIVTDSRENDSGVGNIGYMRRHYKMGGTWEMSFGFGKLPVLGIPGTRTSMMRLSDKAMAERPVSYAAFGDEVNTIYENLNNLLSLMDALTSIIEWMQNSGVFPTDASVGDDILTAKTPLIADIAKMYDVSWAEPTRALDTVYQNTTGKIRIVTINVALQVDDDGGGSLLGSCYVGIYCDTNATPTTVITGAKLDVDLEATSATDNVHEAHSITFVVPPDYYYKADKGKSGSGIDAAKIDWHEWDLH